MFYIYKITNKINNKIYIGKTNNVYARIHSHLSVAKNGLINVSYRLNFQYNYIHKAINKYGKDNFSFEVIDQDDSEDNIFIKEKEYIFKFNSNNNLFGYNLTKGGEGSSGRKLSELSKQKIREKATGRLHSIETKQKMKNSRSGEGCKHNILSKEQVIEILNLRNINKLSYNKIGKIYNVSKTSIRKICIGTSWTKIYNLYNSSLT